MAGPELPASRGTVGAREHYRCRRVLPHPLSSTRSLLRERLPTWYHCLAPSRQATKEVCLPWPFLGFPMCWPGPWLQSPSSSGLWVSLLQAQTFFVWAWQGAMVPDCRVKSILHGWASTQNILYLTLSPIYLETDFFLALLCLPSWAPKPVLL